MRCKVWLSTADAAIPVQAHLTRMRPTPRLVKLSVIFCIILVGYSHQFLPVAGKSSAPLYWPCNLDKDNKLKVLSMDDLIL